MKAFKFKVGYIYVALFVVFGTACLPDEQNIDTNPNLLVQFSADTIQFDTLFTGRTSLTRRLIVKNTHSRAMQFSEISLLTPQSPYQIYVNGMAGSTFQDIVLEGGDSLLLLLEVKFPETGIDTAQLVEDVLAFKWPTNIQEIKILGWSQNAIKKPKQVIKEPTVWKAGKPILVEDTILVQETEFTIEPGAQIFFDQNATLIVENSIINMNATPENRILLTNSRLDKKNVIGQWQGVYIENSVSNFEDMLGISCVTIRNASAGLQIIGPSVNNSIFITSCIIENIASNGLEINNEKGVTLVSNTLINNCGNALVSHTGGVSQFIHCTFVNLGIGVFRQTPAIIISDTSGVVSSVDIYQSIIWGTYPQEIETTFEIPESRLKLENNIIKTSDQELAEHNIISQDMTFLKFQDPINFNYRLDSLSPAIDAGSNTPILSDLDGNVRDELPDIGAYEYQEPEIE